MTNQQQQGESKMTNYNELAKDKVEALKMLAALYDGCAYHVLGADSSSFRGLVSQAMHTLDADVAQKYLEQTNRN